MKWWGHKAKQTKFLPTSWRIDKDLLSNLKAFLGTSVQHIIPVPKGLEEGDRVLYRLSGGQIAQRKIQTQADLEEFKAQLEEIAAETGGGEVTVTPRSEHSPLPATIDILGDLCFDRPVEAYAQGDSLLPSPDWAVEWLMGALFTSAYWRLYYVDFAHPKVKAFLCHTFYEDMMSSEQQRKRAEEVVSALRNAADWHRAQRARQDLRWARLVMLEGKKMETTVP